MENTSRGGGDVLLRKNTMKILRGILWGIIVFNVLSVIMFLLPPGRIYYMPGFTVELSMLFFWYVMYGLLWSGVIGAVLTVLLIIYSRLKIHKTERKYIVLLILFALTIPAGWFAYSAAMGV